MEHTICCGDYLVTILTPIYWRKGEKEGWVKANDGTDYYHVNCFVVMYVWTYLLKGGGNKKVLIWAIKITYLLNAIHTRYLCHSFIISLLFLVSVILFTLPFSISIISLLLPSFLLLLFPSFPPLHIFFIFWISFLSNSSLSHLFLLFLSLFFLPPLSCSFFFSSFPFFPYLFLSFSLFHSSLFLPPFLSSSTFPSLSSFPSTLSSYSSFPLKLISLSHFWRPHFDYSMNIMICDIYFELTLHLLSAFAHELFITIQIYTR